MLLRTKSLPLNAMIPLVYLWHITLRNVSLKNQELKEGRKKDPLDVSRCIQFLYQAIGKMELFYMTGICCTPPHRKATMTMQCKLEDTEATYKANMEVDNFSSLTNVAELKIIVPSPENISSPAVNEKLSQQTTRVLSATVVVKGLSQKTTEEDLHQILSEWGPLRHVRVIKERNSGTSRGFAFIDFPSTGSARSMMDKVGDEGVVVDGRKLFFEYR
ncbi:suppressor of ABI3-5 isoform X1 [Tanacetum coccineum]